MSKKNTLNKAIKSVSLSADRVAVIKKLYEHLEDDEVVMQINYTGSSDVLDAPVYHVYTDYGFRYVVILHNDHEVEKYIDELDL